MGFVVQKSVLVALGPKLKAPKGHKIDPVKKRRMFRRRLQRVEAILEQARIWAYAMILPTKLIVANKEAAPEFEHLIREVTRGILGDHVTEHKIERISGKIARNILDPELTNFDSKAEYYPPCPPPEQLRHHHRDTLIAASTLTDIYSMCPSFENGHPDAKTWREVADCAQGYETTSGESLRDLQERLQFYSTWADLGLPFILSDWSPEDRKALRAWVRSSDPERLVDVPFVESDLIPICAINMEVEGNPGASMAFDNNMMTLYPGCLKAMSSRAPHPLRTALIIPDETMLSEVIDKTTIGIFLHEITHSSSVLRTDDHEFEYPDPDGDDEMLNTWLMYHGLKERRIDGYTKTFVTSYGVEASRALRRRDARNNTNKTEDNADSWALTIALRVHILIYPEFSFRNALLDEDLTQWMSREIPENVELTHHCTLLQCLRHPEAGKLSDHPLYDASKDPWAPHTGRKRPETVAELLEVLKRIDGKTVSKYRRNKQKRDKKKAKRNGQYAIPTQQDEEGEEAGEEE